MPRERPGRAGSSAFALLQVVVGAREVGEVHGAEGEVEPGVGRRLGAGVALDQRAQVHHRLVVDELRVEERHLARARARARGRPRAARSRRRPRAPAGPPCPPASSRRPRRGGRRCASRACSSTPSTTSPGWKPAWAAGLPGTTRSTGTPSCRSVSTVTRPLHGRSLAKRASSRRRTPVYEALSPKRHVHRLGRGVASGQEVEPRRPLQALLGQHGHQEALHLEGGGEPIGRLAHEVAGRCRSRAGAPAG